MGSQEISKAIVENGRVLMEDGKFVWASLEAEIEFEAGERGWDAAETRAAIEWAWCAMEHTGR